MTDLQMARSTVGPRTVDSIPYLDFGGTGQTLHFLHANGYPPACYEPLLRSLAAQYHVAGMLLRPLWPKAERDEIKDWKPFTADLLQFLDEQAFESVIGVGHSIGAIVTLRAALQRPERFRALVLIEPVLFPPFFMARWAVARALGLGYRLHPLIQGALNRRRTFNDLDQLFAGYRRRPLFRYFSDENLRVLIRGLTIPAEGGYALAYSPEWEAHIYHTAMWNDWDLWAGLGTLKIPTLMIRATETDTFWRRTIKKIHTANPDIKIASVPESTHLIPMERPEQISSMIQAFIGTPDSISGD